MEHEMTTKRDKKIEEAAGVNEGYEGWSAAFNFPHPDLSCQWATRDLPH